jgi:hypothetical protein
MKILTAIKGLLNRFSKSNRSQREVKECQLMNILRTDMFKKMSVQDKLTSLAKLAALFQADFNTMPAKFGEMMVSLAQKLNKSVLDSLK